MNKKIKKILEQLKSTDNLKYNQIIESSEHKVGSKEWEEGALDMMKRMGLL